MANTYKILGSSTVSVATPTITFTNISPDYTDLVLRFSTRHDNAFSISQVAVNFNGDSTSNAYSETVLYGNSVSASSGRQTSTALDFMYVDANSATANTFSTHEMYIPSYVVNGVKPIQWVGMTENNAGTSNAAMIVTNSSLWNNSNAISSITLTAPSGRNFMVGSTFYLYGVYSGTGKTKPSIPTIGTAIATGATTATVAFTPTSATGVDASYTALSTPGSITVSSTSSPITVTGLTTGTAYTFQVRANNPGGSSAYSSASNSVTPIDPAAWDSIATFTPTSSSLTFSSIPSTYRHLQIRYVAKTGSNAAAYIQFNGDTGSNYAFHYMRGNRVDISPFGYANQTTIGISPPDNGVGTTQPSTGVIDIIDYQSTTKNKTVKTFCGRDANITSGAEVAIISGLWRSTSAINSITITTFGTNFTSGTQFALYGIKGS